MVLKDTQALGVKSVVFNGTVDNLHDLDNTHLRMSFEKVEEREEGSEELHYNKPVDEFTGLSDQF